MGGIGKLCGRIGKWATAKARLGMALDEEIKQRQHLARLTFRELVDIRGEGVLPVLASTLQDRSGKPSFIFKLRVQRGFRDPCFLCHAVHANRADTFGVEKLRCEFQEAFA